MTGLCPRCQAALEIPQSGPYQCPRCRATFEVFITEPRAPQARAASSGGPAVFGPAALDPQSGTPPAPPSGPCAAHPNNAAVDVCERCGDFICAICRTTIEGRRYCPRCFDLLYSRGSLLFTQRSFNTPAYALTLGVASLVSPVCCYGLISVPCGIIGIILGVNSLREMARRPDLPGRNRAIGGIVCSAIGLLGTVVFWGFLAFAVLSAARR